MSLFRLQTGHSMLASHRFRVNLADSKLCDRCMMKEEDTTEHALLACPALENKTLPQRQQVRAIMSAKRITLQEMLMLEDQSAKIALLDLIKAVQKQGVHI